jgi:nucleoside-diphosphate-sugar epimerase
MRVLVTGASGFVGAAVKHSFEREGADVVGVDVRRARGVLNLDLADEHQIAGLFANGGFDVVTHLAASAVGASGLLASARTDPRRAVDVNIGGTIRLLQAAQECRTRSFVYASSTTVYGPAHRYAQTRISEDAPLRPMSIYGATKASAEHLGCCVAAETDLTFIALRLPLVYGPGRWYGGALAPLYELLATAETGQTATLALDATETDWVHVDDAAAAFTAVAALDNPEMAYHVVGHSGSMLDLGRIIVELFSAHRVELAPKSVPADAVFPLLDDSAARRDFGFSPRYADAQAAAASLVPGERQSATTGSRLDGETQ